jgi:penicillin-binding protein 1A
MWKYILGGISFLFVACLLVLWITIARFSSKLPKIITVQDYTPLKVTEVFDRNGEKIGEFLREKRMVIDTKELPKYVSEAFIAAEDSDFYRHTGINFQAIFRAMIANLKAGRTVQGGSTITQQVAKQILLTSERSIDRKIKEAILARRMEKDLSKEDIMYLYLNQIYFGQGAYGIEMAAQVYFHKQAKDLDIHEATILAGLPKAPSAFSPVTNPTRAKIRQRYVLSRMVDEKFITEEQQKENLAKDLKVYFKQDYEEYAPFFLEAVRLQLIKEFGEDQVLDKGLKVYTSLDLKIHTAAQVAVKRGVENLDKRQGYRGPLAKLLTEVDVLNFIAEQRNELLNKKAPFIIIDKDGKIIQKGDLKFDETSNLVVQDTSSAELPSYLTIGENVKGVVSKVDDKNGFVEILLPDGVGLIDFQTMKWARMPDPSTGAKFDELDRPSQALKKGDVVLVRLINKTINTEGFRKLDPKIKAQFYSNTNYIQLELEQEPLTDGSLISIDQKTQEIIAMVGGYDFRKSEFNKAIQAARQTGSSFKPIVYASALDKGFQPNSEILDIPIVFKEEDKEKSTKDEIVYNKYKPANHSKSFNGDILFREALIKSLNIPTIRITDTIGVNWVLNYARRLGIFSPLNQDITLSLGSSGITLYEMTKVYSQFGRLGKKVRPIIIKRVENEKGEIILEDYTLDKRFSEEIVNNEQNWHERVIEKQIFGDVKDLFIFADEDQLIKPQTAYIMTNILQGVIEDEGGTGGSARGIIPHPMAGKTGTTDNYYDAWFIGYSPLIATGVWIGYEQEKSLGRGEVGGRAALPIWSEYMKAAHIDLPYVDFPIPSGIVFSKIDASNGKLANEYSKKTFDQAFEAENQPNEESDAGNSIDEKEFLKEDLSG